MLVQGPGTWGERGVAARPVPAAVRPFAPRSHFTALIWLEYAFVGLVLLMLSQALLGRLGNPDGVGEPPAWLRQMWLPAYAVVLALVGARIRRLPRAWLGALVVLPILAWTVASTQWSLAPDVTARRALALVFPTLFALYLAARFDWRSLIRIVAIVSAILAVGSAIAAVAVPSFGVHDAIHPGAWRGLFFEKNALGGFMVRATLACLCVMTFSPRAWWAWLGAAGLCAGLVVMSTSTTALVGLAAVIAGVCAIAFLRRGPVFAVTGVWVAAAAGVAALAVFAVAPEMFFDLVGKDATLTGRTNIWAALMRQVALRPVEGFGYGAFWGTLHGPAAWVALQADWHVLAADNAWAEILIQLGWVGVALFGLTLLAMIPCAVVAVFRSGPAGYWAALLLVTLVLFSITESIFLKQNDLTWVLYVATLAKLLQGRRGDDTERQR
jgi:exopolysaccharide production protein ExoQ